LLGHSFPTRRSSDLRLAPVTQAWLAVSQDPAALVTGGYFFHKLPREAHSAASSIDLQEGLLQHCLQLTSTPLPPL
jgi:hypothetical protein